MGKTTCLVILCLIPFYSASSDVVRQTVSSSEELEAVFSVPLDSVDVHLMPGVYHLTPSTMMEPTCGNCQDPDQSVFISVGLKISGKKVRLSGPQDSLSTATIITHSGYGLFLYDCEDCSLENLTITGGVRDADPNATDAAVVVKNSTVTINDCEIRENIGDSTTVINNTVGIIGICGRENSKMTITDNRITRNSWDGIALYRDAEATISENLIDGIDKAHGKAIGGGRGVGIGMTWNARATIERNLVKRYWKGIGIFVNAEGNIRDNMIEDILTWGIALWDAGKGEPVGRMEGNVIFNTGACGVSITRSKPGEDPGYFRNNLIVGTGKNIAYDSPDSYCYQCAIAEHAVPVNFPIADNLCFNNRRATDDLPNHDVTKPEYLKRVKPICLRLSEIDLFGDSDFTRQHCADIHQFNLFQELFD
jgi:parallel beta-helix repeat protein